MRNRYMVFIRFPWLVLMFVLVSCTSSKPISNSDQTGDSPEAAIVINSAEEEHRWLNEHYPNYRILVQEVIQQPKKSFDVVTIRTEAEERKTFYFDITRFYGKN